MAGRPARVWLASQYDPRFFYGDIGRRKKMFESQRRENGTQLVELVETVHLPPLPSFVDLRQEFAILENAKCIIFDLSLVELLLSVYHHHRK